MPLKAVVCWPACSANTINDVRKWVTENGRSLEKYTVKLNTTSQLDALLVQVFASDIVNSLYDTTGFEKLRQTVSGLDETSLDKGGFNLECRCFAFSASVRVPPFERGTTSVAASAAEADLISRAFDKPMLEYEGFFEAQTGELIRELVKISKAFTGAKARVDALFCGDVAVMCHGLRKARPGDKEAIVFPRQKLTGRQKEALSKAGIRTKSVTEWSVDNDILIKYHGVDVPEVIKKRTHVYFMGLMIPPASVSFDIARSRIGGPESIVHLLDAMMLKKMIGSVQRLPCIFGDVSIDASLSYTQGVDDLKTSYITSRDEVKARACANGSDTDLAFDVRTTEMGSAVKELEHARKVQAASKGMPVVPMYYGLLKCFTGEVKIAVEGFEMTLKTWMSKQRTREAWVEVLCRTVWCVSALDRVAGMSYRAIDASQVLLRNIEGKKTRRAVPVRLLREPLPYGDWDVRMSGVESIEPGRDRGGMQNLARRILDGGGSSLLPVEIRQILEKMAIMNLEDTVDMLARKLRFARPGGRKKPL